MKANSNAPSPRIGSNTINEDGIISRASIRSAVSSSSGDNTPTSRAPSLSSRLLDPSSGSFNVEAGLGGGYSNHTSSSTIPTSSLSRSPPSHARRGYSSRNASSILQDMTVNKLQFDKLHCLYGRTEQLQVLNRIVAKMSHHPPGEQQQQPQERRRQLVLLQGDAGSGKSTLAMSVLQKFNRQNTLFAKGKFDVTLKDEPYSGIGEACRELVRNLLLQVGEGLARPGDSSEDDGSNSDEAAAARRRCSNAAMAVTANEIVGDLRTALGSDAVLLYSLIPNLHLLLDGTPSSLNGDDDDDDIPPASTPKNAGGYPSGHDGNTGGPNNTATATTKPSTNDGYAEAKTRFQHTFRRFIRALSTSSSSGSAGDHDDLDVSRSSIGSTTNSGTRKLIFVLDDIHWADTSSLELLEAILTDTENKTGNLLVIATYRSEQVSSELEQSIRRIHSALEGGGTDNDDLRLFGLTTIALENWQIPDLTSMLADLLNESRPENVLPLAECVHRKTRGNIFFSIQFLRALAETGKLTYQFGLCKWTWDDPNEILQHMSSTENVIQLLTEKLKALPNGIYKLLPAIACLGCQFRGFVVEFIVAHWNEFFADKNGMDVTNGHEKQDEPPIDAKPFYSSQEIVHTLVDLGLIVVIGNDHYRWEHDKVQEAALGLLIPLELAELQYIVGDVLLEKLTKSQVEEMLFVVSDLIDRHPDPTKLPKKKRERIRELNLAAGRKARESSAFHAASIYLRRGIQLLETDCWLTDYCLALDVYSSSAEANFCSGNIQQMRQDCNIVLENATRCFVDKRRAYDCLLYSTLATGAVQETQVLGLELLARLGCTIPKRMRSFHILTGAFHINSSVDKTLEKVGMLKRIEAMEHKWVVCLLDTMSIVGYHIDDNAFFPLVLIESLRSTLTYGLSDKSPVVLVAVGLLLVSLGNLKGAKAYCDKAMELLDEYPGCASRTIFLANEFVLHWQMPFEKCLKPLLETFHMGLKVGDIDSAAWSAYCYVDMALHGGRNLHSLLEDCKELCARVAEVKQLKTLNHIKLVWQLALCLSQPDTANDLFRSDDRIVTHNELRRWIDENNDAHLRQQVTRNRMHAKFWLGDYEGMAKMIKENKTDQGAVEQHHPSAFILPPLYLQCAICCFTLFRRTRQKSLKKSGMWFANKIYAWAKKGNPNVIFGAALLDAEIMSLVGLRQTSDAACRKNYESAIFMAARRGCFHDHALAQELYGAFCLRQGDTEDARYHTERAIEIYAEWGATRLASQLRVKHSAAGLIFPSAQEQQQPPREISVCTPEDDDGAELAESTLSPDSAELSGL